MPLSQQLQRRPGDHICPEPQRYLQIEENMGQGLQTGDEGLLDISIRIETHTLIKHQWFISTNVLWIVFVSDQGAHGPTAENRFIRREI